MFRDQTDMKLSNIKQELSQLKQSVGINYLHKGSMSGIVDTPVNIQVQVDKSLNQEMVLCVA